MSERIAYERYSEHLTTCRTCKPSDGVLCSIGAVLHQAWRKESLREFAGAKRPRSARVAHRG